MKLSVVMGQNITSGMCHNIKYLSVFFNELTTVSPEVARYFPKSPKINSPFYYISQP